MDLGTVIGLIGTFGCIMFAIFIGGSVTMFIDIPSILIVVGGTIAVTLVKYPLSHTMTAFSVGMKTFFHQSESPVELIQLAVELATVARRDGLLGLENAEIKNAFFAKGIQLAVDGYEEEYVRKVLALEISQTIERHERSKHIFSGMGEAAPAMGMIGTLIGLVQMMANMSDPTSIGPAMAVALLTTLYGAVISNASLLPLAEKLNHRSKEEKMTKKLILDAVSAIQSGVSPKIIEEMLITYLPGKVRAQINFTGK